ncbi:MAG: 6-phosphogluconolactonase [Candidatus Dormibacteria bacterium]
MTALPGTVHVAAAPVDLAAAAAARIVELSRDRERFSIAVSGGSTPRFLFEALASSAFRGAVDWGRWHVFFADERAVPPDDENSNYRLVHDALLSRVSVPDAQVHRMRGEAADLDAAAAAYSSLLESELGTPPRLDLLLLGLGTNGHTASLFPGTRALDVDDAWATRGRADYQPYDRITMTFPTINAATHVAVLVAGADKAPALRGVAAGTVPAARVRPKGELTWYLDGAAAGEAGIAGS